MNTLRRYRPSPATLIALLALGIALGGTAYAATKINGKNIALRTLPGKALKKKSKLAYYAVKWLIVVGILYLLLR